MILRGMCDLLERHLLPGRGAFVEGLDGMPFVRESGTDAKVCRGSRAGGAGGTVVTLEGEGVVCKGRKQAEASAAPGPMEEVP